jgi:hypothetical protein
MMEAASQPQDEPWNTSPTSGTAKRPGGRRRQLTSRSMIPARSVPPAARSRDERSCFVKEMDDDLGSGDNDGDDGDGDG